MALLSTLTDAFTGYPDPYRWLVERGDPQPAGGRLRFFAGGDTPGMDASMVSVDAYLFDLASVAAELPAADDPDYFRSFSMQVAAVPADADDAYAPVFEIDVFGNTLYCQWSDYERGVFGNVEVPYDPASMLYLRMRATVTGGVFRVVYDTAPDAQTWTQRGVYQAPASAREHEYRVRLSAFYGPVYLADFNLFPSKSLLRIKQPDGSYVLTGTRARPLYVRMPDGSRVTVDGSGRTPLYQRQPDGTWRIVAYRAAR